MDAEVALGDCTRCRIQKASHIVRTDKLCSDCFTNRVGTKVSKRLEGFRVSREPVKNVLLALSLGCCSLSLLVLLDQLLEKQRLKTQRTGFNLFVVHVSENFGKDESTSTESTLETVRALYPSYMFSHVHLEDAPAAAASGGVKGRDSSENFVSAFQLEGLSASSREDMLLVMRHRLVMHEAHRLSCSAVLFGDSTTKLTERILSETAKGRGFALPQLVNEVVVPGEITCMYPLRDLFRGEIEEYAKFNMPEIWRISASNEKPRILPSRNLTIDKLMGRYAAEMEGSAPSTVANVLKTTTKLVSRWGDVKCQVCNLTLHEGTAGLKGWGGDQDIVLEDLVAPEDEESTSRALCYGCTRSLQRG